MSKALLWICKFQDDLTKKCTKALVDQHFQVELIQSIEGAKVILKANRFGMIALSNDYGEREFHEITDDFFSLKEARSARLILFQKQKLKDKEGLKLVALGFRDFIPLHLPLKLWMKRFLFASGAKDASYLPGWPSGGTTVQWVCKLQVPSFVTWINEEWVRIESHLMPPPRSRLIVNGEIALALGQKTFAILVEALEFDHLDHRFSVAIIGRHELAKKAPPASWDSFLKNRLTQKPQLRVMVAVGDLQIREKLFTNLPSKRYIVHSVIRLQNLAKDHLYFSPDLVVCDPLVALGKRTGEFENLLKTLPKDVPIIVAGNQEDTMSIQETFKNRVFFMWDPINPPQFEDFPLTSKRKVYEQGLFFQTDHSLGLCQIDIPARVTILHPLKLAVSSPFQVKIFSLVQLVSPHFQKEIEELIWFKITEGQETGIKGHSLVGYLTNLNRDQIFRIADRIEKSVLEECRGSLKEFFSDLSPEVLEPIDSQEAEPVVNSLLDLEPLTSSPELLVKPVKTRNLVEIFGSQTLRYFIIFVLLTFVVLASITIVIPKLAENYKKSGSIFVNQLKQFSHHPAPSLLPPSED